METIAALEELIVSTKRDRPGLRALAQHLAPHPVSVLEDLGRIFIRNLDDCSLGKLYLALAINRSDLDPELILEGSPLMSNLYDAYAPLVFRSSEVLESLLARSDDPCYPLVDRLMVLLIAGFIITRDDMAKARFCKSLEKLKILISLGKGRELLEMAQNIVEQKLPLEVVAKHFLFRDPLDHLPERSQPGEEQRPYPLEQKTPQPARNALCPCGSGKKYKTCCLDKEILSAPLTILCQEKSLLEQKLAGDMRIMPVDDIAKLSLVEMLRLDPASLPLSSLQPGSALRSNRSCSL